MSPLTRRRPILHLPFLLALLLASAGCNDDGGSAPTATPTASHTSTPTLSPTATTTATHTGTRTPSATPTPTDTPTLTATATSTPTPTLTFTPSPTATPVCEVSGVICTIAGTGLSVFDGDGKPARQTSFYWPLDVEFDSAGRPLILDFNNLRLRRINDDGRIQTVIGLDFEAYPVEGALASETALHHASDVERDAQGVLYLAGFHASVVFGVGLDDRVFIIAGTDQPGYSGDGGPAREAQFLSPYGVAVDGLGGVYISDIDAHAVRYVDPAGIIHTVAGTGTPGYSGDGGPGTQALLNRPTKLDLDADGRLYICDTDNSVIRRLDRSGTISTFAGTGERGSAGEGGPASLAQLNEPSDLLFRPDGTLYIADTGNHSIRRIDRDGIITTVVGNGQRGFAGDGGSAQECQLNAPSGLRFAPDGSLWIADTFNQRVRRVAGF